jgi:hypothetical protein
MIKRGSAVQSTPSHLSLLFELELFAGNRAANVVL